MEKKQISLKTLLFSLLLFFVLVIVLFALYIFFSSSSFEFNDDSDSKLILPVGHLACESDECRFDWARENQNVSLCFDIGDETLRAACSASITQSLVFESSVQNNDSAVCDSLSDISLVQNCRDNYYYVSALNQNDSSFCSFIENEVMKNDCYE
ncbi:hypothetical protein H6501_05775 [Candidatus Woesearchaeota archaeon]|nr:hypothetical protein [Candidatus Woesearchaeota archaeon]